MNILISGPCGVGKSTVSKILASRIGKTYLNFDELGLLDMEKRNPNISPFSHEGLNLKKCMQIMLEGITKEFILEIGGDNVFHSGVDNYRYLNDLIAIKSKYSLRIIILISDKNTLYERFLNTRNGNYMDNFNNQWLDWKTIIKPNWEECLDFLVDTTHLSETETCHIIEDYLNQ
jgi:shikimate kinase